MADNTLTIENTSVVVDGFHNEEMKIANIQEGANVDGALLNKLGTSIPTPFARLHLFDSAFTEIADANAEVGYAVVNPENNYMKLVSVALDMLEFLYLNGDSSEMEIIRWNVDSQAAALKSSFSPKHKKFGEALESAWNDGNYAGRDIYMFKYGNEFIGGTSPLSLVFTNPNLRARFQGLTNNHMLFDTSEGVDLLERAKEFRLYLYKLYIANSASLSTLSIGKYITARMKQDLAENEDMDMEMSKFNNLLSAQAMMAELQSPKDGSQSLVFLTDGAGPLTLPLAGGGIFRLLVKDLSNVAFSTDYRIKPTREHYKNYMLNGASRTMKTPLVLNNEGLSGARYIDTTYWISGSIPVSDSTIPVYDRKLPRTEIEHPYLMASDFLQDTIIELSYNIQKEKFYTGVDEDTRFLLPLNTEFFKYFAPEDLKGMIGLDQHLDQMGRIISVTVTLRIPLEGEREIILKKEYKEENKQIIHAFAESDTFNIGIFPFFEEVNSEENHYNVMAVHTTSDFSLRFYNSSRPAVPFEIKDENGNGEYVCVERTTRATDKYTTKHYEIEKAFDIIEVSVTGGGLKGKGIILPHMRKIDSQYPANNFTFGVDFGTTNTQIAFSTVDNGPVETFHVDVQGGPNDEVQMVYLNDHDIKNDRHLTEYGFGMFSDMHDIAAREFVTPELSKSQFPMRTAVCEVDNLSSVQKPGLFSSLNIGFNYSNEISGQDGKNRYRTELKWDYSNNRAHDRIRVFFEELLWMMRNKSILNNGGRNFNVVVTYPQAMDGGVEQDFKQQWKKAAENVGFDPNRIEFQLESIAPYYSFSRQKGLNDAYLNMDIGGGSTDILYYNPKKDGDRLTFSVRFAANDIWGDGCNPMLEGGNNGYIRFYETTDYFKNLSDEKAEKYRNVKNNARKSAESASKSSDIINFLFKNDDDYEFVRAVKRSKLALLPVLHFTALVYYMAHIVESFDVDAPKTLTFTGMGSTYLSMLGDTEHLEKLANAILDSANEKDGSKISIIFAENPKQVTAEGAVMIHNASALGIELIRPERSVCYGVEDEEAGETRITIGDIREDKEREKVMSIYKSIYRMLDDDQRVREILSGMGLDKALSVIPSEANFMELLDDSFESYRQIYQRSHKGDADKTRVQESLFFWPLKDGLFKLGVDIAEKKD